MTNACAKPAELRYRKALKLYATTNLSAVEICDRTNTSVTAFRAYLQRHHRDLLFDRHGVDLSSEETTDVRLRRSRGQSKAAHDKYKEAILACCDSNYIEYSISQIALMNDLDPNCLNNQLRRHYPMILMQRDMMRREMGISDNCPRGMKDWCGQQYAEAVAHLKASDDTVRTASEKYNVPFAGLREHLSIYHKDVLRKREERREQKRIERLMLKAAAVAPTGPRYRSETALKYEGAIKMLKETDKSTAEVANELGLHPDVFREYLKEHEPELAAGRGMKSLDNGRKVRARSAEKYKEAIAIYETSTATLKDIAQRLNLKYTSLHSFVARNCPESVAKHNALLS